MRFEDYQSAAKTTAVYPKEVEVLYTSLALAEEAGEVAGKVSKLLRKHGLDGLLAFDHSLEARDSIKKEMGDVLWQLSALASDLQMDLADIAEANLLKLASRAERGVVIGEGDNR